MFTMCGHCFAGWRTSRWRKHAASFGLRRSDAFSSGFTDPVFTLGDCDQETRFVSFVQSLQSAETSFLIL